MAHVPQSGYRAVPQKGHTRLITCLDYSKDSRFILTGALDRTARLWDTRNKILIRVFDAKEPVLQVAFVPDGKRVVMHDEHGHLLVFDIMTGELLRTITNSVWSRFPRIRPFSDGRRLLISNENKDIRIVDLDTGKTLKQFNECPIDKYPRTNIDLSRDDRWVITSCVSGQVQVRELATDRRIASYETPIKAEHGTAFLGDGQHAVLFYTHGMEWGAKNNGIQIWNLRTGKVVATHPLPKDLKDFAIAPDGKSIALLIDASLSIGEVQLRDLWSFKLLERFTQGIGNNHGILHFSSDGRLLVAPGDLSSVALFDLTTKRRVTRLSSEDSGGIEAIAWRPSRWQAATVSGDGNVYLFDIAHAALTQTFDANVEYVTALDYSPDGRFLATVDLTNPNNYKDHFYMGARIWDVATGRQIFKNVQQRSLVRAAHFSPDGQLLLLGDRKQILVKDTRSWKTVAKLAHDGDPYSISLTQDKRRAAISSDFGEDGIFDLSSGKRIAPFPMSRTKYAYYLADGNRILLISDQGRVELWDLARNARIRTFTAYEVDPKRLLKSTAALAADATRFVGVSQSNTLDVWDVNRGALLHSIALPTTGVAQASFLPNSDYVALADTGGALRVMNLGTRQLMSMIADGQDWIVYTDDGYFDGSRRGGRLVATVNGLSSFRIDQAASRSNRPDIILERMGLGSKDIIAHYAALHQRRLKKLGLAEQDLDQTFAEAPSATIVSVTPTGRTATLEFEARSNGTDLARYNVYVNDVPIFGAEGKPLVGRMQRRKEIIELASGDNDIEVGVLNRQGLESMRPSVSVLNPEKVVGDLYYLAFGVSRYQNSALNLKYASKDANDLAQVLGKSRGGFGKVHLKVYTDEAVTTRAVDEAKVFLSSAKVDDTVVLFAAGHGVYAPNSTHDYFFLTHQSELNRLNDTALAFEEFEELLRGIVARKKLFLLDTCYSGDEGGDASPALFAAADARGLASRGIRRKVLDASPIRQEQQLFGQRDRYIYNDLSRRSGAIVLSSSRGTELSYERDDIENGLFTEHVMRALTTNQADLDKDRQISTDELREFVSKAVSTASGGLQNPVVDRDNLEVRFALPLR